MVKKLFKILLLLVIAGIFARAVMVLVGFESPTVAPQNSIAVLDFEGTILMSEPFIKSLKKLEDDKNVHGIIIRVNSPGGAVTPSNEIYDYILAMHKPVYVSMSSVAASGGYMISLAADKIYAMPSTITGSIGVIMKTVNTEELFKKIGISSVVLKSGKFKDAGSPDRPMTDAEREVLMAVIMDMYSQFVDTVAARRNLDRNDVLEVADGRIVTGNMAKNLKLVDALGSWRDAYADMKSMLNIPDIALYEVPRKKKWWENMVEEIAPVLKNTGVPSGLYYMTEF